MSRSERLSEWTAGPHGNLVLVVLNGGTTRPIFGSITATFRPAPSSPRLTPVRRYPQDVHNARASFPNNRLVWKGGKHEAEARSAQIRNLLLWCFWSSRWLSTSVIHNRCTACSSLPSEPIGALTDRPTSTSRLEDRLQTARPPRGCRSRPRYAASGSKPRQTIPPASTVHRAGT